MTNEFIALVKNTTLVLIVSILDLLGIAQAALADPNWVGMNKEAYVFAGLIYWSAASAFRASGSRWSAAGRRARTPSMHTLHHRLRAGEIFRRDRRVAARGVGLVVDTRAVAASRRPGFSKRQLAAGLDKAGIGYLHLQKLGTPKEGRDAARGGNLTKLFDIYEKHLATPDARAQLDELTTIVSRAAPYACSATSATSSTATASASRN